MIMRVLIRPTYFENNKFVLKNRFILHIYRINKKQKNIAFIEEVRLPGDFVHMLLLTTCRTESSFYGGFHPGTASPFLRLREVKCFLII